MPNYKIGTDAPIIPKNLGSGKYCSEPQTSKFLCFKRAIQMIMATRITDFSVGPDAVKLMQHYLDGTGNSVRIDVKHFMKQSYVLRRNFNEEVKRARTFTETLPPGTHSITSQTYVSGKFTNSDSTNLFYAAGQYKYWGNGTASVQKNQYGKRTYHLKFEFFFYDKYDWSLDKVLTLFGVNIPTDKIMGSFHRQGYAHDFDVKGRLMEEFTW